MMKPHGVAYWIGAVVVSTGMALSSLPAFAASASYFLNQSNADTLLPDGTNYLKVTVADSTAHPGAVEFSVQTLSSLSSNAGSNYGIQSFGFNSTQPLAPANIYALPSGWSTSLNTSQDGFGKFDFVLSGPGNSRADPLTFYIGGRSDITVSNYAALSSGNAGQGNTFFAAHVAGFNDVDPGANSVTSAYFGGSTPAVVPVPAAAWLFGSALLGLVGIGKKRTV